MEALNEDTLVSPIPDDAPPLTARWKNSVFSSVWTYRDEAARALFYICRSDFPDGSKDVVPQSLWRRTDGILEWRFKGHPTPRPLYRLHELSERPDAPVVVVEGEKTADAAAAHFPDVIVTTSSGGAKAADKSDWSPLKDRNVYVWPDNDAAGAVYAHDVTRLALAAGAASVLIVSVPSDCPDGWDLADQLPDGVTHDALRVLLASAVPAVTADAVEHVRNPLEGLIDATRDDPGAAFEPEALKGLIALKDADPAAYERLRTQLKQAGCRVTELDRAIAEQSGDTGRDPTQADILMDLAQQDELFHAPDGTCYVVADINGHRETWPVRSKSYKRLLTRRYYNATYSAPNSEAVQAALNVLEARAHCDGPECKVFVRVGSFNGKCYIDLCDDDWRAIEFDANGWRVANDPPIRFRRSAGMRSLPIPVRGGSIDELRPFLNVQSDSDFVLVVAWLLAALRGEGPYPVLVLAGEQGSAKSTFAKICRSLTDPNTAPIRATPREERDLFIAATNSHVLAFDNISTLPPWLSDTLCRLATGGGFAARQLFSDLDEVLFDATRPTILNGIVEVVTRPDLGDRALSLMLKSIAEENRRSEDELWAAFNAAWPVIFAVLLDAMVHGIKMLPNTQLPRLPRMADFALWATACETAFWSAGTFWSAYSGNRNETIDSVIDADPVASALRTFWATRTVQTVWTGTATDLLGELADVVGERVAKSKSWPNSARDLSSQLLRVAPFLRKIGIEITPATPKGHSRARTITISNTPTISTPVKAGQTSSPPSAPSADTQNTNVPNGLASPPLQTITTDADAAATETVRNNSPKTNGQNAADGVDAGFANQSAGENATSHGWRGRI